MGFLFIWIVVALIGYAIGKSKGRPGAGFVWGLLLGPIGWLVILVAGDFRRKCPECLGAVPDGARRCGHCGVDLGETITCPFCGESGRVSRDNLNTTVTCAKCEKDFNPSKPPPESMPKTPPPVSR